jgi:hypothetical protein
MTGSVYRSIQDTVKDIKYSDPERVNEKLVGIFDLHVFDERYLGYYDHRLLRPLDTDEISGTGTDGDEVSTNLRDLYSRETTKKIRALTTNQRDIKVLRNIAHGIIKAPSFVFDGQVYSSDCVWEAISQLRDDIAEQKKWLSRQDRRVIRWYHENASAAGVGREKYLASLRELFELQKVYEYLEEVVENLEKIYMELILNPPTHGRWYNQLKMDSHKCNIRVNRTIEELKDMEFPEEDLKSIYNTTIHEYFSELEPVQMPYDDIDLSLLMALLEQGHDVKVRLEDSAFALLQRLVKTHVVIDEKISWKLSND